MNAAKIRPNESRLLRLWNIGKMGLQAIARNKMRSLLTVFGIIIGVGCVITMLAVGTGASSSIQATINSLGTNFIMLFPGASTQSGARVFTGDPRSRWTTSGPSARRSRRSPASRPRCARAPDGGGRPQLGGPRSTAWTSIGCSSGLERGGGDFFTDVDVRTSARVAVLGVTVAPYLVSRLSRLPTEVSTSSVLLAFGFAAVIGIFFGYYPARKALRLDPIDALRYE